MLESVVPEAFDISGSSQSDEIAELHASCGVYTRADMAKRILSEIGWTADADLSGARLLEPAAGNGIFVVEAASRLLTSELARGRVLEVDRLRERIIAFELLEDEAASGRKVLRDLLVSHGICKLHARELADLWFRTGDFLLQESAIGRFSHVAGNPPYARWSKIPQGLRRRYDEALPKRAAKGDLFLPFLDRGIELLETGGRLGFLCSDRWKFMAFAEDFRRKMLPQVDVILNETVEAGEVYQRAVDIYPSVLVLRKREAPAHLQPRKYAGDTLEELGFEIRVGPALGCTPAFVLEPGEGDVELELLAPWLRASDVRDGKIVDPGRRILCMHDEEGRLLNPSDYPRAFLRLRRFEEQLRRRSIVTKHGAPWYRPIDRILADGWSTPKLLVPELSKHPQAVLDASGAVPSHGIYAIVPKPGADLAALARKLSGDGLAKATDGIAPKVKGGYVRCYKRILEQIRL